MDIYSTPYTYHIAWTALDKHYYGVRYAKGCSPEDLWKTYFTSSKIVEDFRKQHGEPDVVEVRRTFDTPEKARIWEERVLTKLDVTRNDRWLNACISGHTFYFSCYLKEDYVPWNKGKTGIYSEETLKKMSQVKIDKKCDPWNKNMKMDEDFCLAVSAGVLEKWKDPDYVKKQHEKTHYDDPKYRERQRQAQLKISDKISQRQTGSKNSFFGKKHTEESNESRREKLTGLFWWTDGQVQVRSRTCPPGFRRGMKPKTKSEPQEP